MHDMLVFRKVCAQWVSKKLSKPQKEVRIGLAVQHLFMYHKDPAVLELVVTGDKSCCHYYEPETKRDSCDFRLFGPLKTSQRKALQLGRRTDGHSGGLALVTAARTLGPENPSACETVV